MGRSRLHKLLFDDSDENEIMRRILKGLTSQRKRRRYIECDRLAGHKRLYLDYFADTSISSSFISEEILDELVSFSPYSIQGKNL